jgi:hypothetical protein
MRRNSMLLALKKLCGKLFGIHICTEFTKWETFKGEFSRPTEITEYLVGMPETLFFSRRWQERSCIVCGKIEQRNLTK